MWYGSDVSRQGSARPLRSYQSSSFRRKTRRAGAAAVMTGAARFLRGDGILALMKIYTRTGDSGETGLLGGLRVSKSHPRVGAYGDVDELNACLGCVLAQPGFDDADLRGMLEHIQKDLFAIGARLADPAERAAGQAGKTAIGDADIQRLEAWIDRLEQELPPLRRFILPGGSGAGAMLHLSRTVCRRAERAVVALGAQAVEATVVIYVNRLSDLLFVLARVANHRAKQREIEW